MKRIIIRIYVVRKSHRKKCDWFFNDNFLSFKAIKSLYILQNNPFCRKFQGLLAARNLDFLERIRGRWCSHSNLNYFILQNNTFIYTYSFSEKA